jgi:hypothetical protein
MQRHRTTDIFLITRPHRDISTNGGSKPSLAVIAWMNRPQAHSFAYNRPI